MTDKPKIYNTKVPLFWGVVVSILATLMLIGLGMWLASCATKPKEWKRAFPPCLEKNDVRCKKK